MTEISEKIRMKAVEFPNPKGTVLQLNHVVKLREPGKSFGSIHVNLTSLEYFLKITQENSIDSLQNPKTFR